MGGVETQNLFLQVKGVNINIKGVTCWGANQLRWRRHVGVDVHWFRSWRRVDIHWARSCEVHFEKV